MTRIARDDELTPEEAAGFDMRKTHALHLPAVDEARTAALANACSAAMAGGRIVVIPKHAACGKSEALLPTIALEDPPALPRPIRR